MKIKKVLDFLNAIYYEYPDAKLVLYVNNESIDIDDIWYSEPTKCVRIEVDENELDELYE